MGSVLGSASWGEPALRLLSLCEELDPGLPAAMHIRHSERSEITSREQRVATLTENGFKASREFGELLPGDRSYRLYHSPATRSEKTAEYIHRGLASKNVPSQLCGVVPFRMKVDNEKLWDYIMRDWVEEGKEMITFLASWVGGRYPPSEMESSQDFAMRAAETTVANLSQIEHGMDVYVSHDVWLGLFMFHWFGAMFPGNRAQYLEGFILQLTEDRMRFYTQEGLREAYYPHWWDF
jgi:broad specificity phosphatase PhoE